MFSNLRNRLFPQQQAPPAPQASSTKQDIMIAGMFVSAIALLLTVAGYVVMRMASDNAYKKKWEEYEDCGWA